MNIFSLIIGTAKAQELLSCSDGTMASPDIGCVETPAGIVNPESGLLEILLKFTEAIMTVIASAAIIFIIYGAIRYAMNRGSETQVEIAKKIILWSGIGLVGGLVARYVVSFILNIIG